MKKLLALILTLFAFTAFAQLDDVINKPRPPKIALFNVPKVSKYLLNIFTDVEVSTLVDEMKRDGVTERNFNVALGVSGRITTIYMDSETNGSILPFTIKIDSDKNVYLKTAAIGLGNFFENTVASGELNPFSNVEFVVFKLDQGINFRDIKTIGYRIFDVDVRLPLRAISKTRYIALEVGFNIGGEQQEITLDNGQKIHIVSNNGNSPPTMVGNIALAYGTVGNFVVREELGKGTIEAKAGIELTRVEGAVDGLSTVNSTEEINYQQQIFHTQLYGTPSLAYSIPFKKEGRSLTFTVKGNLAVVDRLRYSTRDGGQGRPMDNIDLSNRNRQPIALSVKITF